MGLKLGEDHLGGYVIGQAAPGTYSTEVWDYMIEKEKIESVLDVGCGLGYAAKYFKDNGCKVKGIDGSPSAIKDNVLGEDMIGFDFTKGKLNLDQKFDLVWSAEFVEHVREEYSENFLDVFNLASKFLLITHASPGQGGHHHVNEQPASYWIKRIENLGFKYDESLTKKMKELIPEGRKGQAFRKRGLAFRRK